MFSQLEDLTFYWPDLTVMKLNVVEALKQISKDLMLSDES